MVVYSTHKLSDMAVVGPVSPSELGVTLPHEQPLVDLTGLFMAVPTRYAGGRDPAEIAEYNFERLENIGKIRQFPYVDRCTGWTR